LRIPEEKIEEVRAATDILSVVQGYVALKKKGQNWFGLCPFHSEDSPSFSVHQGKQIFRCFGCGKGGNAFSFLMEIERITYPEAVRVLAEKAGIELPKWQREDEGPSEAELLVRANTLARDFFYQQLINETTPGAREAKEYLNSRGYGKDVIERFLIGYAPDTWESLAEHARATGVQSSVMLQAGLLKEGKEARRPYDAFRHRVIFPIRNLAGRVIAFGGRRLREENESEAAKYINSPETAVYKKGRELFGLWEARNEIRKQDRAVLVEGYTDCTSLVMAGVGIAVASLGTSLTTDQARLVKRFTPNVFIMYDGDSAGLAAARRAIDVLLTAGANPRVVVLPENEDPDSFVQKRGGEAAWELINAARSPVEFQLEYGQRMKIARKASVRELLSTAALISSPVDQDMFMQEIAARTGVNLDALRTELSRQGIPLPASREAISTSPSEVWPKPGPLVTLAETLVRCPALRNVIFEMWTPEKADDPRLRELFDALYSEWQSGAMREPESLLNVFPEPPLRDFVSGALYRGDEEEDSRKQQDIDQQVAVDCVRKMEATELRERIQKLREKLAQSNSEDDSLLKEINALVRRERELRARI
jgi:DNA primase